MNPNINYAATDEFISNYPGDTIVLIMEEFNRFNQGENLLTFLNSDRAQHKKIVIATLNDIAELKEKRILNRRRFRYVMRFEKLDKKHEIEEIISEYGVVNIDRVIDFITTTFETPTKDTVTMFMEDMCLLGYEKKHNIEYDEMFQVVDIMNVHVKNNNKLDSTYDLRKKYCYDTRVSDIRALWLLEHPDEPETTFDKLMDTAVWDVLSNPKKSGREAVQKFFRGN